MDQVLNIPELLEIILAHLSIKELLLTKVVCRPWNVLVATSPCLQRELFLQSRHNAPFWLSRTICAVDLNPLLFQTIDESCRLIVRMPDALSICGLASLRLPLPKTVGRPLEDVFLTQPPTRKANIAVFFEPALGKVAAKVSLEIQHPDGLRMAHVMACVEELQAVYRNWRLEAVEAIMLNLSHPKCLHPMSEGGGDEECEHVVALLA